MFTRKPEDWRVEEFRKALEGKNPHVRGIAVALLGMIEDLYGEINMLHDEIVKLKG